MKQIHTMRIISYLLMISPLAMAFVLATTATSWATPRDEAQKVLYVLRQTGAAEKLPDEMQSAGETFSTAEQYFQNNDLVMSNRYYLLTIQKARVMLANLLDRNLGTSAPVQYQPEQHTEDTALNPTPATSTTQSQDVQQPEPSSATTPDLAKKEFVNEVPADGVTSEKLVGNSSVYTVVKNDTYRLVAAKLGVTRQHLAKMNNLDPKASLKVGQKLKYNNRKIVPQAMKNGIVINIPDRTLYYFKQGKLTVSIPVALGTPKKNEKFDWKTPTGKFKITAKQKDPTWHVPPSIQSEMEDEGKEIQTSVPPGPKNPLGKYAIRTSIPGIMIHSTTKPGSIYSFASHGCIRVSPAHMEEFFKEIKVNTPGEIIYRPVKLAVTEEGRIFMEVHQDAYGKETRLDVTAKHLIEKHKLSDRVDWKKVESIIRNKSGIAEDISL